MLQKRSCFGVFVSYFILFRSLLVWNCTTHGFQSKSSPACPVQIHSKFHPCCQTISGWDRVGNVEDVFLDQLTKDPRPKTGARKKKHSYRTKQPPHGKAEASTFSASDFAEAWGVILSCQHVREKKVIHDNSDSQTCLCRPNAIWKLKETVGQIVATYCNMVYNK